MSNFWRSRWNQMHPYITRIQLQASIPRHTRAFFNLYNLIESTTKWNSNKSKPKSLCINLIPTSMQNREVHLVELHAQYRQSRGRASTAEGSETLLCSASSLLPLLLLSLTSQLFSRERKRERSNVSALRSNTTQTVGNGKFTNSHSLATTFFSWLVMNEWKEQVFRWC